jgi:hypothetical protein
MRARWRLSIRRAGLSLGQVAPESRLKTLLALTLDGAALARKCRPGGERP